MSTKPPIAAACASREGQGRCEPGASFTIFVTPQIVADLESVGAFLEKK